MLWFGSTITATPPRRKTCDLYADLPDAFKAFCTVNWSEIAHDQQVFVFYAEDQFEEETKSKSIVESYLYMAESIEKSLARCCLPNIVVNR